MSYYRCWLCDDGPGSRVEAAPHVLPEGAGIFCREHWEMLPEIRRRCWEDHRRSPDPRCVACGGPGYGDPEELYLRRPDEGAACALCDTPAWGVYSAPHCGSELPLCFGCRDLLPGLIRREQRRHRVLYIVGCPECEGEGE